MRSELSEISPVMVQVKVEVPWDRVQQDMDAQFRKLGQQARVRGFRQGKVPRSVVRQLFGKQVRGEVAAQLIEQGLVAAVTEHDLSVVAQPEIEPPDLTDGQPLTFTAKVEIRPKLGPIETAVSLVRPPAEVSDEAVTEEVDRMRASHAEVRVPEPLRPARAGDQLTINYTVSIDGEDQLDMGAEDRVVVLGDDQLIAEFEQGLLGSDQGGTKQISVKFADDHSRADLRGKTATFDVRIETLQERILPELDDELAKDLGDYQTLLELRLDIRKRLEEVARRRAESEIKEQLVDRLIDANDVPVPPSMVKQEEARMAYELAAFLQMTGNTRGPALAEELHDGMHERAERKVRAALILSAVARQQGIEVGDADVDSRLAEIAERTGKHIAKVRADYQGERRETLETQILQDRLMDYLLGQATISDGAPGAAEEPGSKKRKKKKADAAPAEADDAAEKPAPKKRAARAKAPAEGEVAEGATGGGKKRAAAGGAGAPEANKKKPSGKATSKKPSK